MKVTGVDVWPVTIPFTEPFEVWRGVAPAKHHVIVEVHTDEGITGIGEASPFLYYGAETQHDVVAMVRHHLEPIVVGTDPFDVEALNQTFDTVIDGHRFSKAAIEMALWDIQGRVLGVALHRLLGGRVRQGVPVVGLLLRHDASGAADEARTLVGRGFEHLKIKVGFGRRSDVAVVRAVREAVGDEVSIRVDAEESYDLKTALRVAHALDELDVELFSQPVSRHLHEHMQQLRRTSNIPVLLDECIDLPEDVSHAAHLGTGDAINVKLMKCGGIVKARRMFAIAQAAGMGVVVGSMIESGPGTACGAHLAVAHTAVVHPCELVGPTLLAEDVLVESTRISGGQLDPGDAPGLGIELDRDQLSRLRSDDA